MDYKGYYITQSSWGGFDFWPGGENGYDNDGEHDNAKHANSIEDAKTQIDELISDYFEALTTPI